MRDSRNPCGTWILCTRHWQGKAIEESESSLSALNTRNKKGSRGQEWGAEPWSETDSENVMVDLKRGDLSIDDLAWVDEEIHRNGDYGTRFEVKLCPYQVGEAPWILRGNVEWQLETRPASRCARHTCRWRMWLQLCGLYFLSHSALRWKLNKQL